MKAIVDGDLIVGIGAGDFEGVEISDAMARLPRESLRCVDGAIIDVSENTSWFVDPAGDRHIVPGDGWFALTCGLTEPIEQDGSGGWLVVDHLAQRKMTVIASIKAMIASKLAAGAPIGEFHVALDDGSRADLTAMATTALAASGGALSWPTSYALGWITMENKRVPLPQPADGLAFADASGTFYAAIIQNGRDLKDAVVAAEDGDALDAIDITAGWPDAE